MRFQFVEAECVVFLLPQSSLKQGLGVVDVDATGSDDAYGLEVLGAPDAAEAALPGAVAGVVDQARHTAAVLSRGANRHNGRSLRRLAVHFTTRVDPVAVGLTAGDEFPDRLLALPGALAPERQRCAVPDLHFAVADIDPNRFVGPSFEHDPVPAGRLEHCRKPATEIAPGEPTDRIRLDPNPLHFGPPGTGGDQRAAQRRGHHGDHVGGVETIDRLVLDQIEEDGRAHAMSADPLLVLAGGHRCDLLRGQIEPQDLARVTVHSPLPRFHVDTRSLLSRSGILDYARLSLEGSLCIRHRPFARVSSR